MSDPNMFMVDGRWMTMHQARVARGLEIDVVEKRPVISTESVLAEKKALATTKEKKALKEALKDAGEDITEYEVVTEVVEVEETDEAPKPYTGEKKIEDMTYFEMLDTLKELGHKFDKTPKKAEAYKLLTETI